MTTIIGIDPGATTGVCAIVESVDRDDFQVAGVYEIPWQDRLSFFRALFTGAITAISGDQLLPEIVVIEDFKLAQGHAMDQVGSRFPSVRIIGIVEAFMSLCDPVPMLVFQPPSSMARVEMLPQHAHMFPGLIHAGDAYRHARYYHVTTGR
jgi:hypothetical protein